MPFDHTPAKPTSTDALDTKTYRSVRKALEAGSEVRRDFRTGYVVPDHLKGALYSPRDLIASAMAEIDLQFARGVAKREAV